MFLAVIAIVRLVRPWYAWSNTATASLPVATRAIFTAFSTASAPELNSADFLAWSPGVSSASATHTSTYPSYGVTMKQVWVNAAACSCTRETTDGAALPTVVTAMPEPRSIRELPSTSRRMPPPAASTKTGSVVPTPSATYCLLRASFSCDRGPGISVTRLRCWVREVPPATVVLMAAAYGRADCGFHRSPHRRSTDSVAPIIEAPSARIPGMALARFKGLCIDVADARVSGEYWATMLGWTLEP